MTTMLSLCIATLVLSQVAPSAVVLIGSRSAEGRPDAIQWDAAGYRSEAAAEGLLRAAGYAILDPKRLPEFSPKSVERARELLREAIKASGAHVAVGIQVISVKVTTPMPPLKWSEVTLSGRPIPAKALPREPSVAEVAVRVWLLESGDVKPYVDGKSPVGCEVGHGSPATLVGGASQRAMGDVLRRFLRLRAPRLD